MNNFVEAAVKQMAESHPEFPFVGSNVTEDAAILTFGPENDPLYVTASGREIRVNSKPKQLAGLASARVDNAYRSWNATR